MPGGSCETEVGKKFYEANWEKKTEPLLEYQEIF